MSTPLRVWLSLLIMLGGCESTRAVRGTTSGALKLSRVVLYRNGVAYFERAGVVDGERLTIKARKDQLNDFLKSLTVIDRSSGKTVSVSVPLDPRAWQDAALSMLMPGRGRLAQVLDALRGTLVEAETSERTVHGRIVLVEPQAAELEHHHDEEDEDPLAAHDDYKLTLLDEATLHIVQLSSLRSLRLRDGDLIMQLDRHLDATSGEGMFQQVDVVVHFADDGRHDLAVSYVAQAPLWKPTYRLVLPEDNSGKALLQVWAVVSNVSGENWDAVKLSLTSGAPLAFRYDLHTPEEVERPDLTRSSADKRARVAVGETSFDAVAPAAPPPTAASAPAQPEDELADAEGLTLEADAAPRRRAELQKKVAASRAAAPAAPAAVDLAAWSALQPPAASAKRIAGLTRFDVAQPLSLQDGSASMVQLVNQLVPGEQTFLYKPGGSGPGYELNPYHVVRFQNATDFVLEPGPISIYASGSFVGEGLSETIASHDRATIPFAAEPGIVVRSSRKADGAALHITKIVRGVVEVESFQRIQTTWQVEAKPAPTERRVLVRQPRASAAYNLLNPPPDTEVLPDAYYIPVQIRAQQASASVEVLEQTPSSRSLSIWDSEVPGLLQQLLAAQDLTPAARAALQPILDLRQAIGRVDSEVAGWKTQQSEIDRRAEQERQNLWAIQKDPNAGALRKKLSDRLSQLANEAAALGRAIVEKSSRRMEQQLALEDKLRDLDLQTLVRPRS